ncbi:MAG: carboxylating nicotinate-nucleotide diphosphorylase [Gammaproteobacteria bacterium]|nr:carboxylating nicotinate-nucleotide diphosphorylase [Gammaproteobacteria bacterium]NNJ90898.1 carboxylating nicotinate-nucleotide diphosphorylase [Gammaproteobacteria bacterium]
MPIDAEEIQRQVKLALNEDVGSGDLTAALVPVDEQTVARVISRDEAVLAGRDWFDEVFRQLDKAITIEWSSTDGETVSENQLLCTVSGNAASILTGERTALNFLQTLSAVATRTRCYVDAVSPFKVNILDTRKTIPGLRLAQKYAVTCGGGVNHRVGLYDAVLIKENHIMAAGSISKALQQALLQTPADTEIEIEVESLDEMKEALQAGAQRLLLDNFSLQQLREAVLINQGRARLEASGNVNLQTVRAIAETGVNDISIGELTKHINAVDLSMRFARS